MNKVPNVLGFVAGHLEKKDVKTVFKEGLVGLYENITLKNINTNKTGQ
jgi:hypothetical protein